MIDKKDLRDLIEYSSYLGISDKNLKSPIFSPKTSTEFSIDNGENRQIEAGMGLISAEDVESKIGIPISGRVDGTKKPIGAIVGEGPKNVSTQPDTILPQILKSIEDKYKKQTSTYKYIGSKENIASDWNNIAQKVNKDPNTFFNTARTTFSRVAQDVQTYRANQEYGGPENIQDASKTFMSILTNDMMQLSRGPDEANLAESSLEGTSMGKMLSGGGQEQQQLSWGVFEDFLIYTDKYAQFMKQTNPNFDTSILFDMRDRYLDQGTMARGKDWASDIAGKRENFINEQKRIESIIKENQAKNISMDALSGISSQFGVLTQKTSEISSQILNMQNTTEENKSWDWSVQKAGEDVNEDTMGFVIEENNTSRPTRKTSESIKLAFDGEYFNQKSSESEIPISLLAMQSDKAKQELIKALNPEMLRNLIEKETSQGKSTREQREQVVSRRKEEFSQQMLRTMGVNQDEITIPAAEINKNIMSDISQDFKNWGTGINTPANYQQSANADETEPGYLINQQDQTRRFTQQQELLNRLMIDQNSRNLYAKSNNIDPSIMNEWAKNRFGQEKQKYGQAYEMDVLSYAQSVVDPEEFNKSSFLNYDYSKGLSFEDVNKYFSERPSQIYQQKELQFEMMKRGIDNQRKQASMNVWDAAMGNIPEDETKIGEFIADATNKFEVQVEEDSRILFGVREKFNNQKTLDSQRIQNEENSRMVGIGEKLENNLLNKTQEQIFNTGVNVKSQDAATISPEVEKPQDPIYQSAIKSLENTGINAGLMLQRNVKEQNETLGEVDESEVGFVRTREGSLRPTEAQLLREQMIINPESFELTQAAQEGVKYSIQNAANTENIIVNNQRNIQKQQSMMQLYDEQNIQETPENFNIQKNIEDSIEKEIDENDFLQKRRVSYGNAVQAAVGWSKFFRRKGANRFKSIREDDSVDEIEEDIEDEMEEPPPIEQKPIEGGEKEKPIKEEPPPIEQKPIEGGEKEEPIKEEPPPIEQKPIEGGEKEKPIKEEPPIEITPGIIKQKEILPMIQMEEPLIQSINEQIIPQEEEIKNITKEEINKDQIMTSSGQLISGPSANQIIKEQEKVDNKEELLSYIENKIQENNIGLSNNLKNNMNNIANNVSIDNLNKACEGL